MRSVFFFNSYVVLASERGFVWAAMIDDDDDDGWTSASEEKELPPDCSIHYDKHLYTLLCSALLCVCVCALL